VFEIFILIYQCAKKSLKIPKG